jgi:tetratricopeptide (TPR) repeat protein
LALVLLSKRDRRVIFGLLFFIVAFLPPFAHLRYADKFIMADRYSYFPLIGLFLALAAFHEVLRGFKRRVFGVFCVLFLLLMFFRAREALVTWSDSLHFWNLERVTKPEDPESAYFAALMHQERGDSAKALELYSKCLENDPDFVRAYFAMGAIFFENGKYDSSLKFYQEALKRDSPYKADILANIAQTRVRLHQVDAAIACFEKSLAIKENGGNRVWLARLYLFKGERKQAASEALKALNDGASLSEDLKKAFPGLRSSRPLERNCGDHSR